MLFIITGLQLQTTETDKNVPFIPEFVYLLPVSNKYGFTVVGCPSGKANYLVQKKLFGGCINALNRHETLETIATLDTLFSWSLDVVLPQIGCRMTSAHAELGCGKDASSFVMVKSGRVHICIDL